MGGRVRDGKQGRHCLYSSKIDGLFNVVHQTVRPLIGRIKGGQGGNVIRDRTMLCSRQGIEVVVTVEEGYRRPSFGWWTRHTS